MEQTIDIPQAPSVTEFEHIRSTGDLASVILYKEAFTPFEKEIIKHYPKWHGTTPPDYWKGDDLTDWNRKHRKPKPGPPDQVPEYEEVTETVTDFIIRIFEEKLPTFEDIRNMRVPDPNLTVIDPYPVHGPKYTDMGGISTNMRYGHGEHITSKDYQERFGNRTTIHMLPIDCLHQNPLKRYGALSIVSDINELYAAFAYASFLDRPIQAPEGAKLRSPDGPTFLLKPSFRRSLDELSRTTSPMKTIMLGFSMRVSRKITWYGATKADIVGETSKHLDRLSVI